MCLFLFLLPGYHFLETFTNNKSEITSKSVTHVIRGNKSCSFGEEGRGEVNLKYLPHFHNGFIITANYLVKYLSAR